MIGPQDQRMPASGSSVGGRQLHIATAQELGLLAQSLAEAFEEDPIFSWLMPDQRTRLARLRRFYLIELRYVALAAGRAWTERGLAGAAITAPPHSWRLPLRAMLRQAPLFGAHVHRAALLLSAVEMHHPRTPHWYFAHIGVRPQDQGRGLGSALMRPTLDHCDSEGLPAYLEASSERSAALYQRLGFQLIRELSVLRSPPLRLMIRPCQRWIEPRAHPAQACPHPSEARAG